MKKNVLFYFLISFINCTCFHGVNKRRNFSLITFNGFLRMASNGMKKQKYLGDNLLHDPPQPCQHIYLPATKVLLASLGNFDLGEKKKKKKKKN